MKAREKEEEDTLSQLHVWQHILFGFVGSIIIWFSLPLGDHQPQDHSDDDIWCNRSQYG